MTSVDMGERLSQALARYEASGVPAAERPWATDVEPDPDAWPPIVAQLVFSMLLWEAGQFRAVAAMRRFLHDLVDANELRACLARDIAGMLGARYPRADERAARLRAALRDAFARENAFALAAPASLGRREGREYLASLDGVPGFAASRVALLCLGAHALPLDARLARFLRADAVLDRADAPDDDAAALERLIRAGDAARTYLLIEGASAAARRPSAPAPSGPGAPAVEGGAQET